MSRVVCEGMIVAVDDYEGVAWLHVPKEFEDWWESVAGMGEEWVVDFSRVSGQVVRGRVEWRNEGAEEFPDLVFKVEDVIWPPSGKS